MNLRDPGPVPEAHRQNLETLHRAFAAGDVCLAQCRRRSDGLSATVLCMVNRHEGGEIAARAAS